ncbi:Alpha/beta hydrolase family-domain-containing protein [Macrophomina phaseolina]|uniref:Alpha/beta hydrolase family-domain-containing protein n=1 Tax=Macrophomina phaseolina TaxID=35725 RepID=A0ABQ8FVB4_9PEZI|nr:Alpha/beta hydrolase family-domain-containing protein [Macrophomina phaseolina]
MTSFPFEVKEHVIPCQHIRGYSRATAHKQEELLHLSVKQYIPHDNQNPQTGDVTIIGAHAQGFPKELYEPLWADIHARVKSAGFSIRSIWIADVANQGASGVINEYKLGNEPCAFDHARDLLHMVNTFRDQMIRPIVGIGHSMGGSILVNLALLHPRLLETLILIDPIIHRRIFAGGYRTPALASARRRDVWPSRAAAAEDFRSNKYYRSWDPRVFALWIKHGLRNLPTAAYPRHAAVHPHLDPFADAVTLTTTKHQEVFTFLRPTFDAHATPDLGAQLGGPIEPAPAEFTPEAALPGLPFERAESVVTFHMLPFVRPSVLYVFGGKSHYTACEPTADKVEMTGVGIGGSGGAAEGRVAEVTVEDVGHLIPMEAVEKTGELSAKWLESEMALWRERETVERSEWAYIPDEQKRAISDRYLELLQGGGKLDATRASKL